MLVSAAAAAVSFELNVVLHELVSTRAPVPPLECDERERRLRDVALRALDVVGLMPFPDPREETNSGDISRTD